MSNDKCPPCAPDSAQKQPSFRPRGCPVHCPAVLHRSPNDGSADARHHCSASLHPANNTRHSVPRVPGVERASPRASSPWQSGGSPIGSRGYGSLVKRGGRDLFLGRLEFALTLELADGRWDRYAFLRPDLWRRDGLVLFPPEDAAQGSARTCHQGHAEEERHPPGLSHLQWQDPLHGPKYSHKRSDLLVPSPLTTDCSGKQSVLPVCL
jgi:hypothetical protein